ncbi:polysaccharide deacetylase family protein [Psychrobacter sp. S4(2024)]|uniref:polysaccharide deacetylase family protein n=1 Tax=Psychrobacter sp. S4(2024) TaxID=3111913 RepID=UPI002FE1ACB3
MADILTMQDLANGHLDVKALGEAANGDENTIVTTRTGNTYPSAERAINIMFQNGGLPAAPFATLAKMETDGASLADGDLAIVYNETANNGLYVKTAGVWVKSGYDPLAQSKTYTDTKTIDKLTAFNTLALLTASSLANDSYALVAKDNDAAKNGYYQKQSGVWVNLGGISSVLLNQEYKSAAFVLADTYINITSGVATTNTAYKATTKLPVQPNTVYKVLSPNAGNAANAWFDKSGKYISGFNTGLVAESVTSPAAAAFVALSVKNADAVNAYFKSVEPKFSIADLMSVVNTHKDDSELNSKIAVNTNDIALLKKPMSSVTVVNSLKELIALNPEGEADKAYPIGRRVYDHGLRKTVTADGSFWRLEDGRPANVARRVYVYPDWLEIKKALPTYAKKHTAVYNVNSDSFDVSSGDKWGLSAGISYAFGDKRLHLRRAGASTFGNVVFADLTTVRTLNDYVIFDYHISSTSKTVVTVNLLDAAGNVLFYNTLNYANSTGEFARKFYEIDHVRAEIKVSDFTAKSGSPSLANVKKIGISIANSTDSLSEIYLGSVDTATFKPMITLRFDDQRQSVYDNAYPIMEANGLTGLIAVITGVPNLGNSPNYVYGGGGMSKAELLEVQTKGWDLVSHTHVHDNLATKSYDYARADYKASRDYLRDELNVGDIASSFIVSPFSVIGASQAAAQREFFDAQVSGGHLNSHMPRQPTGTWQLGSLWQSLGCDVGDNIDDANALIAIAQNAIDKQRWSIVMMHDVLPALQGTSSTTIAAFTGFCEWLNANRDKIDVVTVTDVVRRIRPVD